MDLPRLVRRSASSWFVLVINALSVGLFGFALRQLQLYSPWLIMDIFAAVTIVHNFTVLLKSFVHLMKRFL